MQKSNVPLIAQTIFDQFGFEFDGLIQTYKTPKSICGYVVCAIIEHLANQQQLQKDFDKIVSAVNPWKIAPTLQKVMMEIQASRLNYTTKHKFTEKDTKGYMRDWVANYEIEDYLALNAPKYLHNDCVYFFRNVAYDYPEAMENIKYEEAQKVVVEKPFTGQGYFVTGFNPLRQLTLKEWSQNIEAKVVKNELVLMVVDVLGHFVSLVLWNRKLRLLDSTEMSYKERKQLGKIGQIVKEILDKNSPKV